MMRMMPGLVPDLLILFAVILTAGCEVESGAGKLSITPSSVQIRNGETVSFTASGGYEYTWSLDNPAWGILSSVSGEKVSYTSLLDTGSYASPQIQTLRVTSTIPGDSSGTNASGSLSAAAWIYHTAGTNTGTSTETTNTLSLSPSSVNISATAISSFTFTVTGGTAGYAWTVSDSTLGAILGSGVSATYTSVDTYGTNTVSVTDASGRTATASVVQN